MSKLSESIQFGPPKICAASTSQAAGDQPFQREIVGAIEALVGVAVVVAILLSCEAGGLPWRFRCRSLTVTVQ